MQHVTVTAVTNKLVKCDPNPIQIWRDDQMIRFQLGKDTEWAASDPIVFSKGWPGGAPMPDVNDTFVADANNPLAESAAPETYSVTFHVTHTPSGNALTHDPDIENQPEP